MRQERIVITAGPQSGTAYEIQGAFSMGRNPDNVFQTDDLQVSRRHAVIEQLPTGTILRDLGSGNGTYVNGRRVLECRLNPNDVIRIGSIEMRFEGQPVVVEPPKPATPEAAQPPAAAPEAPAGGPKLGFTMMGRGVTGSVRLEDINEAALESSRAVNIRETFFGAPQESANVEALRDTQRRLAAVYKANQIISSERELNKLFTRVMDQVFELVRAHNGVIILRDQDTGELVTEYVKTGSGSGDVVVSSTIVQRALDHGEAVITMNAAVDSRFEAGASIFAQNISSAMCAPLQYQDETLGVIYVDTRGSTSAFKQTDLELLVALTGPAAIAIKNAQYLRQVERGYQDTLIVLANAVEARDHYTVGHTWRVTNFALQMAREMGWTEEQLAVCEMGGVLHDVGKIAVDDAILSKPSKLTDEEFEKMKIHPERGARIMQDTRFLKPVIPYCLYHHERYDGRGYPYGLSGDKIPLEGRLVAVADTFDAMTSSRPYRKGLDPEIAVAELLKGRGTQFDPDCVDALVKCYREGKIAGVLQDGNKGSQSIACPFCSTYIAVPEGAQAGIEFACDVCHRPIRLMKNNDVFYGQLVAQA